MVRSARIPLRTDAAVRVATWNATRDEMLDIEFDALSLDDRSWAPRTRGAWVARPDR
jgi:hypothetical protein